MIAALELDTLYMTTPKLRPSDTDEVAREVQKASQTLRSTLGATA